MQTMVAITSASERAYRATAFTRSRSRDARCHRRTLRSRFWRKFDARPTESFRGCRPRPCASRRSSLPTSRHTCRAFGSSLLPPSSNISLFTAPLYKTYGGQIAERRFEPAGFAAPLGEKDIRLTLAAAETLRVPMPLASLLRDRFLTLLAHGGEALDWSAIGQLAARDAGLGDPPTPD